jgi:hypothetical protein
MTADAWVRRSRFEASLAWASCLLGVLSFPLLFFFGLGLWIAVIGVPLGVLSLAASGRRDQRPGSRAVLVVVLFGLTCAVVAVVYGIVGRAAIASIVFLLALIALLVVVGSVPDGRRSAALLGVTVGDATWILFVVYALEDDGAEQPGIWLTGAAVVAVQALAMFLAMRRRSDSARPAPA